MSKNLNNFASCLISKDYDLRFFVDNLCFPLKFSIFCVDKSENEPIFCVF